MRSAPLDLRVEVTPNAPEHARPSARHVPSLDVLRGVAVLMVAVFHFQLLPREAVSRFDSAATAVARLGWTGVDLFFVLSGFLITGILLDLRGEPHRYRTFVVRRSLRIFPLYFGYLAVLFLALPALFPGHEVFARNAEGRWWVWCYLSNVATALRGDFTAGAPRYTTHLWSLAIEEQFYLLWPWAVFLFGPRGFFRACCAAFVGAWLVRCVALTAFHDPVAGYVLMPARMDAFAAGALVCIGLRSESGRRFLSRAWRPALAVSALAILACMWLTARRNVLLSTYDTSTQLVAMPAIAIASAALLAGAVLAPRRERSSRLARALSALGRVSYGMYVFHVPLARVGKSALQDAGGLPGIYGTDLPAQILFTACGVAVTFAIAWVSYAVFEKPFLRLRERLSPASARGGPLAETAAAPVAERSEPARDSTGSESTRSTLQLP